MIGNAWNHQGRRRKLGRRCGGRPVLRQTARTSPPIIVHPLPDININKCVDADDAHTNEIPRHPAESQSGPVVVCPEVAVVADVFETVAVDKGKASCGQRKEVKCRVGEMSIGVEPRLRSKDVHDRMQGNEKNGDI